MAHPDPIDHEAHGRERILSVAVQVLESRGIVHPLHARFFAWQRTPTRALVSYGTTTTARPENFRSLSQLLANLPSQRCNNHSILRFLAGWVQLPYRRRCRAFGCPSAALRAP